MKRSKDDIEILNGIYDSLQPCNQTIRPMSNLINAIVQFEKNVGQEEIEFIFGHQAAAALKLYNEDKSLTSFYSKLSHVSKSKLAAYIEAQTINYDVKQFVEPDDLNAFLNCNTNLLPSRVKDVNHAKYSGNLDENAVIRWVVEERRR